MDSASIVHHSSTVPRSLPVLLPTEVIEEVIDQASDDLLALRCLSLLCKPLLTRARVHLFTSIVIRDVEQMESSREFLDSRPWLPPLVQKVTLFACMPYSYSKPNIPLLDIFRSHLFTQLPNLRAWGMRTEKHAISAQLSLHHSTISCYRIHSRRIQDLELESIKIQDVFHFVRLISAFTSIRKVTCYDIILRKQRQVSLLDSMILNRLSKPLKIQDLSINNTVDIRLVEYLLGSSIATLNNLSITLADPRYGSNSLNSTYFKRLEDSMSWLSKRCSLTVVLLFQAVSWAGEPWPLIGVRHIQWATRILDHVKSILRLGDVTVQIKSRTIAALGCSLSSATQAPVEACKALETVLFAASASKVEFHWPKLDRRRAGRPEFWSPTIMSAFPRLNELGLLSLPSSRPSDPLGHEEYVTCLVASSDSKCIVTASLDGTIIVWDVKRGTVMQEWLAHHNTVAAVSFSPDSQRFVSAGGETLVVWDLSNLSINKVAVLESRQKVGTIVDCAWSPDNTTIASAFAVGSMSIWDALTFQEHRLFPDGPMHDPPSPFPGSLQWSSNSCFLAWRHEAAVSPGISTHWAIWRPLLGSEEPPQTWYSHATHPEMFSIHALAFDPEGVRIAIAMSKRHSGLDARGFELGPTSSRNGDSDGDLGYVQIRDLTTGAASLVLELGHAKGVMYTSFSADGRSLLSVSQDGSMKIWDTDSWQETALLEGNSGGNMGRSWMACFSPDGKYVSSISNDRGAHTYAVRLWRVSDATCIAVFAEHGDEISCLAFTPDGEFLASGDYSGIVHIRPLSSFIGH